MRVFERRRERRARRVEVTLAAALALGVTTEEGTTEVREALVKYRAGEMDWEEFFRILIEYLPQIIAIFMTIFGGL